MSIKPEKYKYTFYTFKIHVHIDWLTVCKHPLANISCNAGQEYFISWVNDSGYLRERSWFKVIQKIFRVFQNPHVIYATRLLAVYHGNVFDPPPVHTSFVLKTLKLVITASLLIIIKACIMK
jgi:hypothetical protein